MTRIVDLSQVYSSDCPHMPFDAPMMMTAAGTIDADGFQDFRLDIQEHSGTHLDAPLHFCAGGVSVADLSIDQLYGPLAVVDISERALDKLGRTAVSTEDIEAWEAAHGRLESGTIVFMRSGWSRYWGNADKYLGINQSPSAGVPGFGLDAVEFLLQERDVAGIGVDTCNIDASDAPEYPVHHAWLGAGKWAVENLAHLDLLPQSGAEVVVGVPKMEGCTGFPARVTAFKPDK